MLRSPGSSTTTDQPRKGSRRRQGKDNQQGGLPRLDANAMNFEKREAEILAVRPWAEGDNDRAPAITLKVSYNNAMWLMPLWDNSPIYQTLFDALGADEAKWVGRRFALYLEQDDFSMRNFPRAEIIKGTKKG